MQLQQTRNYAVDDQGPEACSKALLLVRRKHRTVMCCCRKMVGNAQLVGMLSTKHSRIIADA